MKALVANKPPAGVVSDIPFLISTVPSGQASLASGSDRTQAATTSFVDMFSPLEHYQESHLELVFAQAASTVKGSSSFQQSVDPLLVDAQNITPLDQVEEGKLSELEDQPEQDSSDGAISEDQNYRETVHGMVIHP